MLGATVVHAFAIAFGARAADCGEHKVLSESIWGIHEPRLEQRRCAGTTSVYSQPMRRLERLLAIALFLGARRRVRASDVAERFGVSLRTVYRDMQALVVAGFPVEGNAGDGYRLSQDSYLRPLAFDEDEAEVLAVGARALAASVDGRMREALASATSKLLVALRPAARRRVAQLESRIVVPEFVRSTAPSAAMLEAIREHRAATIDYLDPRRGRARRRTIEPVGLVCRGDAWWLVAWCRMRKDDRAFRVDRVSDWKPAGTFTPREGFSFDEIVQRDRHLSRALFGY